MLGTGVANSTTVIAPTFTELVSKANLIFVGQVASVRAIWETTPQGRAIITIVTFRVEDVWKGSVGAMTQLEFLGGTLDGMTLDVVGMPNFTVGQRDVLFVGDTVKTIVRSWVHADGSASSVTRVGHRSRARRRAIVPTSARSAPTGRRRSCR